MIEIRDWVELTEHVEEGIVVYILKGTQVQVLDAKCSRGYNRVRVEDAWCLLVEDPKTKVKVWVEKRFVKE